MKKISVIIPTYNRSSPSLKSSFAPTDVGASERSLRSSQSEEGLRRNLAEALAKADNFLKKAIDSVLGQTFNDFELIVVDDGSTDQTAELLKGYGAQVRYFYQENKGPSSARNRGIKEAQAPFIAFLDSDDCWRADKLAIQLQAMRDDRECLISHTQEIWYKNGKLLNQKKKHEKSGGDIFQHCLPLCAVGMSTVMARKEFFDAVGLFDEALPCCEDYDLWLRASWRYPFLFIDQPLTLKDGGRSDQVSVRFARCMDKYRIYSMKKVLEKNELNSTQRDLLIEELARKCAIYAKGCTKYGRSQEADEYLSFARRFKQ